MARILARRCGVVRWAGAVIVAAPAIAVVGGGSALGAGTTQALSVAVGVKLLGEKDFSGHGCVVDGAATQWRLMGARLDPGAPFFPIPDLIDAVAEKIGIALAEFASPPPVSIRAPGVPGVPHAGAPTGS